MGLWPVLAGGRPGGAAAGRSPGGAAAGRGFGGGGCRTGPGVIETAPPGRRARPDGMGSADRGAGPCQ